MTSTGKVPKRPGDHPQWEKWKSKAPCGGEWNARVQAGADGESSLKPHVPPWHEELWVSEWVNECISSSRKNQFCRKVNAACLSIKCVDVNLYVLNKIQIWLYRAFALCVCVCEREREVSEADKVSERETEPEKGQRKNNFKTLCNSFYCLLTQLAWKR